MYVSCLIIDFIHRSFVHTHTHTIIAYSVNCFQFILFVIFLSLFLSLYAVWYFHKCMCERTLAFIIVSIHFQPTHFRIFHILSYRCTAHFRIENVISWELHSRYTIYIHALVHFKRWLSFSKKRILFTLKSKWMYDVRWISLERNCFVLWWSLKHHREKRNLVQTYQFCI